MIAGGGRIEASLNGLLGGGPARAGIRVVAGCGYVNRCGAHLRSQRGCDHQRRDCQCPKCNRRDLRRKYMASCFLLRPLSIARCDPNSSLQPGRWAGRFILSHCIASVSHRWSRLCRIRDPPKRDYRYDNSPTSGYHPTYNTGVFPYTSPVGYGAANGYGLYDMRNVWEWCNDWHSPTYYSVS